MSTSEAVVEVIKTLGPIALAYIGVLKNRTDIDRLAASQRAEKNNTPVENQMRKKWYHRMFRTNKRTRRKTHDEQSVDA